MLRSGNPGQYCRPGPGLRGRIERGFGHHSDDADLARLPHGIDDRERRRGQAARAARMPRSQRRIGVGSAVESADDERGGEAETESRLSEANRMKESKQPVAVIAGIGPGLGAALVRRFAREYRVAMIARSADYLNQLGAETQAAGGHAAGYPSDVGA